MSKASGHVHIPPSTTNSEYGFSEVRVETWAEAKALLRTFPISWIFRGQAGAEWLLSTSLERATEPPLGAFFEGIVTAGFQGQAHNYLAGQQLPRSTLEWWALMQHHGAPTRLLDWTESAYVAAFFALDTAGQDCAIWAVDRVWCRNSAAAVVGRTLGGDVSTEQIDRNFDVIFTSNKVELALPTKPDVCNPRLAVQQGLFLCPGSAAVPFMANLSAMGPAEEFRHRVVRIRLANSMRGPALQDLNYMNINRASLFPGLDGFAASLRNMIIFLQNDDPVGDMAIVNGFPFDDRVTESEDAEPGTAPDLARL